MGRYVTKSEELPCYPEAREKIAYYQEKLTKLDSLYHIAYNNLLYDKKNETDNDCLLDKSFYKTKVLNQSAEGKYYDEYNANKDIWFTNYKDLFDKLSQCVDDIKNRKEDAEILRDDWVDKSKQTYTHYYSEYVSDEEP